MNEPGTPGGSASAWVGYCNQAISAIRGAGATTLINVSMINSANGSLADLVTVGTGVVDSGNNFAIEWHQYFDCSGAGSSAIISPVPSGLCPNAAGNIVVPGFGAELVMPAINTAREKGFKLWFGEFGVNDDKGQATESGPNQTPELGLQILQNFCQYCTDNSDVVLGMTYWSEGASTGYVYGIDPSFNGNSLSAEQPQMAGSTAAGTAGYKVFLKGGSQTTAGPVAIPVFQIAWTSGPTFGTAPNGWTALTNGVGWAGGTQSVNVDSFAINVYDQWTIEGFAWATAAGSGEAFFVGVYNWFRLGMDANGHAECYYGDGNSGHEQHLTTGISVIGGNAVHYALTSAGNFFVNGTLVASGTNVGTNIVPGFPVGINCVAGGSGPDTSTLWPGGCARIALSSTVKYTANFTPPTSPPTADVCYTPLDNDSNGYIGG